MVHFKVGRKSMNMESETDILLFKMFRYHVMHNQFLILD